MVYTFLKQWHGYKDNISKNLELKLEFLADVKFLSWLSIIIIVSLQIIENGNNCNVLLPDPDGELYLLSRVKYRVGLRQKSEHENYIPQAEGCTGRKEKKQRGHVSHVRPPGEDASVREPKQRVEKSQRLAVCCLTQGTWQYVCHEHLINIEFHHSCLLTKVQQGGFTSSKEMTAIWSLATKPEIWTTWWFWWQNYLFRGKRNNPRLAMH